MRLTFFQLGMRFALLCGLLIASRPSAYAQSISMTAPTVDQAFTEGEDFATQVLDNPWDMNERRDIGWEENYVGSSVGVSGGVWNATNARSDAYFLPLFGGFKGALNAEGLQGDKELVRYGINHPINASKYTLLSFRLNQSSKGLFTVYWSNDGSINYWPRQYIAFEDILSQYGFAFYPTGYKVYTVDLSNLGAYPQRDGNWTGNIISLRLGPSVGAGAGSTTAVDWIRLVDPNSGSNFRISWNSSGLDTYRFVTLFMDTDNSGFDGTPLAYFPTGTDPGYYDLNTATLPPGNYYFYVTSQTGFGGNLSPEAQSGYTAKLQITSAPRVVVTSPTQMSGTDYAQSELGNAWDMSDNADVDNLDTSTWTDIWRQFINPYFSSGVFYATADPTQNGSGHTDVQVHLGVKTAAGAPRPISTSKYRYLTYRLAADGSAYPTISEKVANGHVTRISFWNIELNAGGGIGGNSHDHPLYEGYNTYTVDLWDPGIMYAGQKWTDTAVNKHLRIDPLETPVNTLFGLDWAKLTTENKSANGQIALGWTITDDDSASFSTSIYYDADATGYDGTLVTTLTGLSAGAQSYNWDVSGLAPGSRYYVYFVTSDGVNAFRTYAPVPVVIGDHSPLPKLVVVPYDYDGDGVSDRNIYRGVGGSASKCAKLKGKKLKACQKKEKEKEKKKKKKNKKKKKSGKLVAAAAEKSGTFYVLRTHDGLAAEKFGGSGYKAIHGDFDGDRITDLAAYVEKNGKYYWRYIKSYTGALTQATFGKVGDTIVMGDYDGDGADDLVTFKNGLWSYKLSRSGGVVTQTWGQKNDVPVSGDFDGDGIADPAVWRPSNGVWYILNTGYGTGHAATPSTEIQWGSSGDTPVPGDWDADGRTDTAVWTPSSGLWSLREIDSGATSTVQLGASGDKPIVGDYDGDGILDASVWRPSNGTWYHNNRKGGATQITHGKSTDQLP